MTYLDARSIASYLDGDVCGNGALVPGPGHGKHDRSLRVFIDANDPDGFRVYSHAGDDWRDCRDHVKERLGIDRDAWRDRDQEVKATPIKLTFATPTDDSRIAAAMRLWDQGVDPRGTPVETYLRSRRLELDSDVAGEVLRWHPHLRAMLALFRNIVTNEPQAISRTFLDHEARKIERKFIGPGWRRSDQARRRRGRARRPSHWRRHRDMHGGAHARTQARMGARLAGAIAAFPVLSGIECLSLLREHDDANKRAADTCAAAWMTAGREVLDVLPKAGKDINDSIKGAA